MAQQSDKECRSAATCSPLDQLFTFFVRHAGEICQRSMPIGFAMGLCAAIPYIYFRENHEARDLISNFSGATFWYGFYLFLLDAIALGIFLEIISNKWKHEYMSNNDKFILAKVIYANG